MLALLVVSLVAACAAPVASVPASAAVVPQDPELRRLGEGFITAGRADGLSIAIIDGGEIRFLNFGTTSKSAVRQPTEGTVYEVGSITKVFTSLLLAHALTEGRVDLQDDVRRYLPGPYPNLQRDGSPVRLVHLADTTSGLPDNIPDLQPFLAQGGAERAPLLISERWKTYSTADLLVDLGPAALVDRPGAASRHSNVAASLLGHVLETVYGQPYDRLVLRYIETPYGMGRGSGGDSTRDPTPGFNADGLAMPMIEGAYIRSAGGLRYSSADMARFILALLESDEAAIRLSQEPIAGSEHPMAGFNWFRSRSPNSGLVLRASGGTFGSSSYIEIRPQEGYGLVLLTNRSGAEGALYDLAEQAWRQAARSRPSTNTPPG